MPTVRLSPSASVTSTSSGLLLRSDLGTFQLEGADVQVFLDEMAPWLNGTLDKEGVAAALPQYSRQSVLALLDLLEHYGLLEVVPDADASSAPTHWRGQEAFFRKWEGEPGDATRRLRDAHVLIAGLEPWGVIAAVELAAAGVGALHLIDNGVVTPDDLLSVRLWNRNHIGRLRRDCAMEIVRQTSPWCAVTASPIASTDDPALIILGDTHWDLVIGATVADDLPLLQALARAAHQANLVSLTGTIEGVQAVIGPVVVPGQTACWNCARLRTLGNANHPESARALQTALLAAGPEPRLRTYLAPMPSFAGQLLALEGLKVLSHYTPSLLTGRLLVQDLITLETTLHTVVRMPWCAVCGGAAGNGSLPGGPVGGARGDANGSSAETALAAIHDPARLRERLAGWVDDRTGIIRHLLINVPDASEPDLPVTATAVLSSYTDDTEHRPPAHETPGAGKGLSPTGAMMSAVGEAIERYSASRYRAGDLRRAALNDLGDDALDPRRLCLYEEWQYDAPQFPFARFDPDRPIDWTQGYWFDSGEPVWVPALTGYLDFYAPSEELFCQVTSNGLAAGSDDADASVRAVCEVVERDAFMLTWMCQLPGRKLLLDDTVASGAREVVRQLAERGAAVELYLLDVGIPIPTVICLGIGDGVRWPGVTVALAAHADARVAAEKAIVEQAHVGPYIRHLMMDGATHIPETPDEVRTLTDHALYYVPADRLHAFNPLRCGSETPLPLAALHPPPDAALEHCRDALAVAGVRVAIADVTSPDVAEGPFRVARALGTNMQPIHFGHHLPRLANPRLKSMLHTGLNPYPHPLA